MGIYVTALNAIYTRLTAAQATGKKLESVINILVGPRPLIETDIDCPSIVIDIDNIEENYARSGQKNYINATIELSLWVKYTANEDIAVNQFFNTTDGNGLLYLIEKIGDVLNETGSQILDPRVGATIRSPIKLSYGELERIGDKYIFQLKATIDTPDFLINSRS